ncbi:MAG TPA: AraC family transcriptional regulator [Bacteroidia bacterium]|nr:AraC family transcriptional regulator [Bacteroidia bacterium]
MIMNSHGTITEQFKISGMICTRCLKILNIELKAAGAEVMEIQLGQITIRYNPGKIPKSTIQKVILENEFEIIIDRENLEAEEIKRWVINYVWNSDLKENLSDYLISKTQKRYENLSKSFSKTFGKTIERYCLLLKIEKVKEYIQGNQLSLSEIAYALGYQNLSSLSKQFKLETGITMKEYKKLNPGSRIPIDKI